MYCSKCGTPNADGARFCERCGTALGAAAPSPSQPPAATPSPIHAVSPPPWQPPQAPPGPYADPRVRGAAPAYAPAAGGAYAAGKSPIAAVLLSFLIPGVGQFYNGDNKKGGIMLGVFVASVILTAVAIGFLGILVVWIWSMIDAYQVASGSTAISPAAR